MIRRFIGVYDADGTVAGELRYVVGRTFGQVHCALCDITHGRVRERSSWQSCRETLDVPFETYHRNDAPAPVLAAAGALPAVVAEHDDGSLSVVATPEQLESCAGSPDALISLLRLDL